MVGYLASVRARSAPKGILQAGSIYLPPGYLANAKEKG